MKAKSSLRLLAVCGLVALCGAENLGPFESNTDIGVTQKGKAELAGAGAYRVTGGGADMWGKADSFQFVWKKMSGNMALTADVQFPGASAQTKRKAALMIRQSLDADSAYVDVAFHGNGEIAVQWRPTAAGATADTVQPEFLDGTAPAHIRIERRGGRFVAMAGKPGGTLTTTPGPTDVVLQDPVYVGLAVCSHDANGLTSAVFSNVTVETLPAGRGPMPSYRSKISIYDIRDKSIHTVYQADTVFEAPNWTVDGKYLLANSGGKLFRIPVAGANITPEPINIDPSLRLNNDHAPSWDGKYIGFSASSPTSRASQVYLANADGSNAHVMVTTTPSYFHGWSPDGKYMAYVYQHPAANGIPSNYDIFRVPAAGGESQQLDSNPGYDDGPDYSPDGKWIYFNSDRSGTWDVWRIPADGAGPGDQKAERVTSDEMEDWFPHPSPDSKWLLFLSFPKGTATHNDKMAGTQLRMMPMPGAHLANPPQIQVVTTFFGGQGTINVNSWSPDSTRFAFVIYEPLPPAAAGR
jgi:hypothetical protein